MDLEGSARYYALVRSHTQGTFLLVTSLSGYRVLTDPFTA